MYPVGGDLSIFEFQKRFPNEDICVDMLFQARHKDKLCPICNRQARFYRVKLRRCYECGDCGYQVYPMKGTAMEGSKLPILIWIQAAYFMVKSKNAISALELQRLLGITYKTSWAMAHNIRSLMVENPTEFCGIIEVDETYIGGKRKARGENKIGYTGRENKTIVFGMYERTGKVKAFIVKNTSKKDLLPIIQKYATKGSTIYSDEHAPYKDLSKLGYQHDFVTHKDYEWGNGGVTTNRIESFWSYIKNSMRGTYKHVSRKWLENYLNEYTFRYNHIGISEREQFDELLRKLFNVSEQEFSCLQTKSS